uniref:Nodule Cysteine-Rich (NCR) secreted peptide n=1 Tax=Mesocestoides corti TaxID=53468 RepID=A0A5K3FAM3_MESCO
MVLEGLCEGKAIGYSTGKRCRRGVCNKKLGNYGQ